MHRHKYTWYGFFYCAKAMTLVCFVIFVETCHDSWTYQRQTVQPKAVMLFTY